MAGEAGPVRRVGMWARRKPAWASLLALATCGLLLVGSFAIYVGEVRAQQAQAKTRESERRGAELTRELARTERQRRRERELLRLQQLRSPTRGRGWFQKSWALARSLREDGTSADPQLQGHAAATLEGFDARVVKAFPGVAQQVLLDAGATRLLMVRTEAGPRGERRSRTILWDRATDTTLAERALGQGVLAFRNDDTPLQLSWVEDDPKDPRIGPRLRLVDVASGEVIREYPSPLEGPSHLPAIALSRDGSRVAAAASSPRGVEDRAVRPDEANTIVVWDAATGHPVFTRTHAKTQDLVLSPDGRLLAAWDREGEIRVWVLPEGREIPPFRVGRVPVSCLAFGRDPVWNEDESIPPWLLAIGESHGLVTVWDLRADRPRTVCRGSHYEMRALDFSGDGALLLSAGRDPAKLWDVATGSCVLNLTIGNTLDAVGFGPEGRHVAVSRSPNFTAGKGAVELLELERGHGVRTLYGLRGVVEKATVSPDGRLVAGVSHEWQVGIWEWPTGILRTILPAPLGHFADSFGMAFDADGHRFACSVGRQAQLWDLRSARRIGKWPLPEGLCDSIGFPSPARLLLIRVETRDGQAGPFAEFHPEQYPRVVRVYDLLGPTPEKAIREVQDFAWGVEGITLSPDWSVYLVEGHAIDGERVTRRFHVYEVASGNLIQALPTQRGVGQSSLRFVDPRGRVLGVVLSPTDAAWQLSLFELPTLRYREPIDWPVNALNADAKQWLSWLGAGDDQPERLVLRAKDHEGPLLQIVRDVKTPSEGIRFSPDGRCAILCNEDGTISGLDLVEMNRRLTDLRLGW